MLEVVIPPKYEELGAKIQPKLSIGVGAVAKLPQRAHSMSNIYREISPSSNIA